jgi:shikimate kinase
MGSGKSSFGKKLARNLKLPFVDTDKEVARVHGPIPEIFDKYGESYFRDLETEALQSAVAKSAVVATGGGAVVREPNQQLLSGCFVIYLRTNYESVAGRLDTERRPLLADNPLAWKRIFEERKHLYEELADEIVETSGRHADAVLSDLQNIAEGIR